MGSVYILKNHQRARRFRKSSVTVSTFISDQYQKIIGIFNILSFLDKPPAASALCVLNRQGNIYTHIAAHVLDDLLVVYCDALGLMY